jgi:uncharacterized protein YndB with AHSA1/START domain
MQKNLLLTWHFNQSPQEVWDYLTKPELIEQWLMKNDFILLVGHKFRFLRDSKTDAFCQVLEIIPHKLLSYSWRKGINETEITVDSVVTWTLTDKNGGTELQLQHNGFTLQEHYVGHNNGWNYCMNRMIEIINSRTNAPANA